MGYRRSQPMGHEEEQLDLTGQRSTFEILSHEDKQGAEAALTAECDAASLEVKELKRELRQAQKAMLVSAKILPLWVLKSGPGSSKSRQAQKATLEAQRAIQVLNRVESFMDLGGSDR
eukprot:scaffold106140_cov20-Tisochrysis_lutea.AAC.1